jgi:3-oxoacyl-[acyl-carrier protein] reductase
MLRLLESKTAVVYGAAGAVGGAAALAFAAEGARVFLTGRRREILESIAAEIESKGGRADVGVVDALEEAAIDRHLDEVVSIAGSVDISFNAVGFDEVQGVALVDLGLEDFLLPIVNWSQTVFLTSRAAAKRMARVGSGVILTVKPAAEGTALASGFGVASAAVDSISRTLASEVGGSGVRVMILQANALPESPTLQASFEKYAAGLGISTQEALAEFARGTILKRLPRLSEFGAVAAFVASDRSSALTGSVIKIDCGSV